MGSIKKNSFTHCKNTNISNQDNIKNDKKHFFSINRGIYKGLKLSLESNSITRPTKSIVKKSLFDTIQDRLYGKTFIECFAGSGQIGFESLSVGAKNVIFFERNKNAFKNLMNNINTFEIKKNKYVGYRQQKDCKYLAYYQNNIIKAYFNDFFQSIDILECTLLNPSNNLNKKSDYYHIKDVIIPSFPAFFVEDNSVILYLDPPFNCRDGFIDVYDKLFDFIESFSDSLLSKFSMIIIECMSSASIGKNIGVFYLDKVSKFGKTSLMYFNK